MGQRIVRIAKKLSPDLISDLIHDEIAAVVIEAYYPAHLCDLLSNNILRSQDIDPYTHEVVEDDALLQKYFGVDRIGIPFNSTYNAANPEKINEYYREASVQIERLRAYCEHFLSPIDKLRLELDELFIPGATVAHFQNKKMLAGIVRISKAEQSYLSALEPHFDALPPKYAELDAQLAANIYLKVPDVGGELEIWDIPALTPFTQAPEQWRAQLPVPIKIKPKQGDLVIFNCRKPHAICAFLGEDRITTQMFMGYQLEKPLLLWN
ncbi:2OG-Fe(II) oxygenase [Janthinobacterium sp. B9-8]|uniref:2OG-Fe(II) oxygenase n=1 Tax=Janthinobacterium sp. B9-8 TaxID=1236179 RepID=UPI00061D3A5D|nr:2OG-Fe(II) oxygenase [Janthinobacterium sp. B9-8]AMC34034.1 hypothetical protein VN23_05205 [Janthinobacterium sp. B9-8]